jgi:hypothetical protein
LGPQPVEQPPDPVFQRDAVDGGKLGDVDGCVSWPQSDISGDWDGAKRDVLVRTTSPWIWLCQHAQSACLRLLKFDQSGTRWRLRRQRGNSGRPQAAGRDFYV